MDNNPLSDKFILRAHVHPAGKITVSVSNKKKKGILKHWYEFLKYSYILKLTILSGKKTFNLYKDIFDLNYLFLSSKYLLIYT